MKEDNTHVYRGKISNFRGQFGFIQSELGSTFFHKSGITGNYIPEKGDEVTFLLEASPKKTGMVQAYDIVFIRKSDANLDFSNALVGVVDSYGNRGFGFIRTESYARYFFRGDDVNFKSYKVGDILVFQAKDNSKGPMAVNCHLFDADLLNKIDLQNKDTIIKAAYKLADANKKYKILFEDCLLDISQETKDSQIELLRQYVSSISSISSSYDEIRSIAKNENLCKEAREAFIKAVYEKADTYYKYKIKFEDCLMDISQETKDSQIELLAQYVSSISYISSNYDRIRSIATNVNLCQEVRDFFIKAVYERAYAYYKYKIKFEDCLMDISQETKDSQIELLTQYVSSIRYIGSCYDEIRSIAKNENLCKEAREAFIKAVYEKADTNDKYKILFEDCLMDISQETKDSQIELLTQYVSSIDSISSNYDQIRTIAKNGHLCQETLS